MEIDPLLNNAFFVKRLVLQVCEIDPGIFRDCDAFVRSLQGRSEILAISVHGEGDIHADADADDVSSSSEQTKKSTDDVHQLTDKMQKQTLANTTTDVKHCTTCDAPVGDAKQYREHFKSEWHKHNLKRKTRQLPPLSAQECIADVELTDSNTDLSEYSF